ncbi:MAG: MSMEG_0569 family flavin-dependent oxidoreductase [Solirubrobacteraceae bacterium]|nr:MSMEG_0569 family flavin-dependent oxidoreductase [Solirubrobacteraceae bacterium]
MPEVDFHIQWPDGTQQHCVSPSRSIEAVLAPGGRYPVAEFVRRATEALAIGSERVRAKYGFACTAAAAQADELQRAAARFTGDDAGVVTVERMGMHVRPPAGRALGGHHSVVIVGGGQAGLSASWFLTQESVDHIVLEASRTGHAWREQRWDAFCLVTPNWQCDLPGYPYAGDDRDGFMVRLQILEYLDGFRRSFDPPVHEGVRVQRVARSSGEAKSFVVETSAGTVTADQVIIAVGGYHVPKFPAMAADLAASVTQVHSNDYKNAAVLPDGAVLVVGSGQSGAQIAEDLHLSGRQVHLAVGTAPRVARFHRGRDVVAWLHDMGHYDLSIEDHPEGTGARKEANHYVTGRGGGRDIDLRRFATEGMQLHGRLSSVVNGEVSFADDLAANLDAADATLNRINAGIDRWIAANEDALAARGITPEPAEPYVGEWTPAEGEGAGALQLAEAGITSVIWATGFRPDWSWVDLDWLDETGYPDHERGIVASEDGLFVLGLPWLHTWGSGRFASIKRDAEFVTSRVLEGARARATA